MKWTQTACYIHFVVNSYWSELDIVCGSSTDKDLLNSGYTDISLVGAERIPVNLPLWASG